MQSNVGDNGFTLNCGEYFEGLKKKLEVIGTRCELSESDEEKGLPSRFILHKEGIEIIQHEEIA
jgi:hypothetical protein